MSKNIENKIKSFLSNVNKLQVGRTARSDEFADITCIEAANGKGYNKYLNREGYGTRKFSVKNSKLDNLKNGKYTLGGIRKRMLGM